MKKDLSPREEQLKAWFDEDPSRTITIKQATEELGMAWSTAWNVLNIFYRVGFLERERMFTDFEDGRSYAYVYYRTGRKLVRDDNNKMKAVI